MRIALDARFVGTPGGLGRYVEELVRTMSAVSPETEFVLFARDRGLGRLRSFGGRTVTVRTEVPWYGLREQLLMPGYASRAKADLVHWPHWNVPLATPSPFVVTIHDLIQLDYPSVRATTLGPLAYRMKDAGFRQVLRHAVVKAATVLVPTAYVKGRVLEAFGIKEERIVVTGEGVTALPTVTDAEVRDLKTRLGIPERYLLALGNAYPHKNLDGLLDAFAILRPAQPTLRLVIAGNDDHFFRRLAAEAAATGRDKGAVFVPTPDDRLASALLKGAAALAQVSFVEGFGLVPLEAMAAGTPVVAGTGGSLPEVLGDAARYADPHEPEAIAAALREVLGDATLAARLREAGGTQAARWRWEDAAKKTLAAYREAIDSQ